MTNPLLQDVQVFLTRGLKFSRISPRRTGAGWSVTFEFSDNTEEVREYECDHATFMEWWKNTSGYLRAASSAKDAFEASSLE